MLNTETSDLWWKSAVIYCLDIETYFDSDDDGSGDIQGLAQRIDHLVELGVTCLWLMPFFPTANRDDGYDVTDYYGIDPPLGTHGDLVELFRIARERGLRVIIDLVINHTSDRHPWFRRARASRSNPYRDFYVWRDTEPPDTSQEAVFPGEQNGIWELDDKTGQWYLHSFFAHQPDLNVANPRVQAEISRVIGFWLELGVSGFRVDAVPYLIETAELDPGQADPQSHDYLRKLREFMTRRRGDAIMLGEVNVTYDEQVAFFGGREGDELTMMFDFELMQRTYLALARQDATEMATTLRRRPRLARRNQFANFLRNHDELTLDKLSDDERQEVFDAFGPDPEMQLFDRGLRRRLPPMLGGDPRRIRMVYSLLFSLPGTPVLFYGEEIGMGENLDVPGRLAVRTPMQWTSGKNGGFSHATPSRLTRPLPEGPYSPTHVNAEDQRTDPGSLLQFIGRLARRYRECPEVGLGEYTVLDHDSPTVLAHRCTWSPLGDGTASTVLVHNLSPDSTSVDLVLDDVEEGTPVAELLTGAHREVGASGQLSVDVEGYGALWLRLQLPDDPRLR